MVKNTRYPIVCVLKDHGTDFNLKPYVEHIEYEETGNEEISSAKIKLNAKFARFIKDAVVVGGVTVPKVEFFDRIFLRFTDPNGDVTEDVLEVLQKKPTEIKGIGDVLELNAVHQGYHIFRIHNLKQYQRESGFDVIKDMGAVYTDSDVRGTSQPTLENFDTVISFAGAKPVGNAASQATSIDFDFSNAEFYIGDAINSTSDRLGSSVSAGGELEFFDWRTVSKYDHGAGTNIDVIQLQFRVSGDTNTTLEVVSKADTVDKLLDTLGSLEPEQATHIFSWGAINAGSNPTGFQIYFGEKEAFFAAKQWLDATDYLAGMKVQYLGAFYEAVIDHTSNAGVNDPITGIGTFWVARTFTPSVNYSPWTKDRPQYWVNSGAGYVHSGTHPQNNKAAQHDHNLVIRDQNHRRTWVDFRGISLASINTDMYLSGGGSEMYRGFRMLLDTALGALGAPFTSNGSKDRFNVSYTDAVVQHNGGLFTGANEYLNWDVFLAPQDDLEVIDMRQGESYVNNPCSSLTFGGTCSGSRTAGWQKGAYQAIVVSGASVGAFLANALPDCLHPYDILGTNNPDFGNATGVESGTPGVNSAVRVKYTMADGARANGAWLNLAFPLPRSGFAGAFTATTVGEKYINPTFDLNNMHLSSLGKRGLNQGVDSEGRGSLDYGKTTGFREFLKLIQTGIAGLIPPGGDFKIRVSMFDTSDNVTVKDFPVTHKDNFTEGELDFPFENFRGRHGIAFTPLQELEILDIFETRNVVRMAFSTLDSYDGEGRYNPFNRFTAVFGALEMQIDAPHFVKPLTATTQEETVQADKPERNFEAEPMDRPQISNYIQLKQDALSHLEIMKFKRVEYSIKRPLRCNIKFGDEFTLKHPEMVDDSDEAPNDEVDLICKKNIFTYQKGKGRSGYGVQTIGVKRFRVFPTKQSSLYDYPSRTQNADSFVTIGNPTFVSGDDSAAHNVTTNRAKFASTYKASVRLRQGGAFSPCEVRMLVNGSPVASVTNASTSAVTKQMADVVVAVNDQIFYQVKNGTCEDIQLTVEWIALI